MQRKNDAAGADALAWSAPSARIAGPAVLVDRDGVLNETPPGGFVLRWSDFHWRPDAIAALRLLKRAGLPVVVVSNQSCVGRGLISRAQLETIMRKMSHELASNDVPIVAWYCCPHAPDHGCDCRKPKPGMLLRASAELEIDLKRSFMIGDAPRDAEAARAVGCASLLIADEPHAFERAARVAVERASHDAKA